MFIAVAYYGHIIVLFKEIDRLLMETNIVEKDLGKCWPGYLVSILGLLLTSKFS